MATPDEILLVRRRTNEVDEAHYTDDAIGQLIDSNGTDQTIYEIWVERAARFSSLVDTVDSGTSRKMSQLHEQAVSEREYWGSVIGVGAGSGVAKVHRITRGAREG